MAVDPAAVILPATHVTAAAEAGADAGASLAGAALAGALVVAAADGAVLAPLFEHAPRANAAISASAPRRLGVEMLTDGSSWWSRVSARSGMRGSRSGMTGTASVDRVNACFAGG